MTKTEIIPRVPQPEIAAPTAPAPKSKKLPFVIIAVIFLLAVSLSFAYYLYQQNQRLQSLLIDQSHQIAPVPTVSSLPTSTSSSVQETPVVSQAISGKTTWYDPPQKVDALKVLNQDIKDTEADIPNAKYYLVGKQDNGTQIYDVLIPIMAPGGGSMVVRIISTESNLKYAANLLSDTWYKDLTQKILLPNVTAVNFDLGELSPPVSLSVDNKTFSKNYEPGMVFSDLKNPKLVVQTDFGGIYAIYETASADIGLYSRNLYLKLKDSTLVSYNLKRNFLTDDQVPRVMWSDNSSNTTRYDDHFKLGKCGGTPGSSVFLKENLNSITNKVQVGKVNDEPVYQVVDPSNVLVKSIYEQYVQTRTNYPSAPPVLAINDFTQKHNHFLYFDPIGDWQLFINGDYEPLAECGKPVIYLYPTKDTQVNVQVGAKITQSEPTYPQSGWTVLAHSNGQLDYQGRTYPNLFWEGTGDGVYPDFQNQGVVVSQKELVSTLKSQLAQLGLNSQESADFMDFWQSKLPKTPYVRLTWLGTPQMNQLAPLTVSPKPDTTIRIFLEFDGLSKPINLIPQKLTSVPRKGFTLVEWGGLLIK